MSDEDIDSILSCVSTKINKIFCDRTFVCCVRDDLNLILQRENYCVLFPKLKPIFLKVLRYQALVLELNVFCIGSGPNQVIVVCKKSIIKERTDESKKIPQECHKSMDAEENLKSTTKKPRIRPTQSYYIPPAQRSASKKKPDQEEINAKRKLAMSSNKCKASLKQLNIPSDPSDFKQDSDCGLPILETLTDRVSGLIIEDSQVDLPINIPLIDEDRNIQPEFNNDVASDILFKEASSTNDYKDEDIYISTTKSDINPSENEKEYKLNDIVSIQEDVKNVLIDSDTDHPSYLMKSTDAQIELQLPLNLVKQDEIVGETQSKKCHKKLYISKEDMRMLAETILEEHIMSSNSDEVCQYSPTTQRINEIVDILERIITDDNKEDTPSISYENVHETLKQKYLQYFNASSNLLKVNEHDKNDLNSNLVAITNKSSNTETTTESTPVVENQNLTSVDNTVNVSAPLYISYNDDNIKRKSIDYDIEENEEIQRAIENINRKSRPLIKHIRNDSTLRINENDNNTPQHTSLIENQKNTKDVNVSQKLAKNKENSVSNWEEMFDENGELHQEYLGEIVKQISCEVKVIKASHDYSDYQNTKYQDLDHVIELYEFPSTFKTQDLVQLYRGASQDPVYVKWCDDTHALLVLSTPAQAQRALNIEHDIIKSRPMSQASTVAAITASSSDLKPAMKRPQTSMQTARRLITTHLGTRSNLSKEAVEQERQALREAREQRRLERQNEKDAWEGRPRNAKP